MTGHSTFCLPKSRTGGGGLVVPSRHAGKPPGRTTFGTVSLRKPGALGEVGRTHRIGDVVAHSGLVGESHDKRTGDLAASRTAPPRGRTADAWCAKASRAARCGCAHARQLASAARAPEAREKSSVPLGRAATGSSANAASLSFAPLIPPHQLPSGPRPTLLTRSWKPQRGAPQPLAGVHIAGWSDPKAESPRVMS